MEPRISQYIKPLNINGLKGRWLYLPNNKNKHEVIFIYGHHSSLERWFGVVEDLSQYGSVAMPDLPGFGGMDSFYTKAKEPTIDNLADYLAEFLQTKYKNKKVVLAGLSFGFVVATRMLQRHPALIKNIDKLISVVGFSHFSDFKFSKTRHKAYLICARILSRKLPSLFFRKVFLSPLVLRLGYARTHNAQDKFKNLSKADKKKMMDFEIRLWHSNDIRTHMHTSKEFLTINNCKKQINLPIWHIAVNNDRYFDNQKVIEHLNLIYPEVRAAYANMDTHAPSIIADKQAASTMIPDDVRKVLSEY